MSRILITGTAGFIGYHTAKALLECGNEVFGMDNINGYYDINLKLSRLSELGVDKTKIEYNKEIGSSIYKNFTFLKLDLEDGNTLSKQFKANKFDIVINLAAQPGIRYSLKNPMSYVSSNIVGFLNLLESCRESNIEHLVFASSSSVYGLNSNIPFNTCDKTDSPISLYAATKKSNELMAHTYSHLFGIPSTGLRFFTVYGPFGRPDMAYFKFTKNIFEGKVIDVYNHGKMKRDFTYINDITTAILKIIYLKPKGNPAFKIYNIGNNKPIELMRFINVLEQETERKANINFLPMQPGDVEETFADISDLHSAIGFTPETSIEEGLKNFVRWYRDYFKVL